MRWSASRFDRLEEVENEAADSLRDDERRRESEWNDADGPQRTTDGPATACVDAAAAHHSLAAQRRLALSVGFEDRSMLRSISAKDADGRERRLVARSKGNPKKNAAGPSSRRLDRMRLFQGLFHEARKGKSPLPKKRYGSALRRKAIFLTRLPQAQIPTKSRVKSRDVRAEAASFFFFPSLIKPKIGNQPISLDSKRRSPHRRKGLPCCEQDGRRALAAALWYSFSSRWEWTGVSRGKARALLQGGSDRLTATPECCAQTGASGLPLPSQSSKALATT